MEATEAQCGAGCARQTKLAEGVIARKENLAISNTSPKRAQMIFNRYAACATTPR